MGGDPMLGCDSVVKINSGVDPGQVVDVEVELIAPEDDGRYISYWRLHDDVSGSKFGDRIWVDVSVNSDKHIDNNAIVEDAADACLAEAERNKQDSPFVDAVAADPILAGSDVDEMAEHQDADEGNGDTTAAKAGSDSDVAKPSAVIPEEPDWLEVGNSLLAMSQSENVQGAPATTSESTEDTCAEGRQMGVPSAPSVGVEPVSPIQSKIAAMGFSDKDAVQAALAASDGDIEGAVAILIASQ